MEELLAKLWGEFREVTHTHTHTHTHTGQSAPPGLVTPKL